MVSDSFRISSSSPVQIVRQALAELREDDVFGRAAQLAYYFFLALFPFLIFVIASLSAFGAADRGRAILFGFFSQVLPPAAFQVVRDTFEQILRTGGPLKVSIGIIFSLWSASMGMIAVMDTLNAAYKVRETRSFIKQYAVSIALTCAIAVLLIISLLIVIASGTLASQFGLRELFSIGLKIVVWPIAIALLFVAFAITYYFAPDIKDREWHWITPGAAIGVGILALVLVGLRIYLHFSSSYTDTYGPLGAVVILLICFYLGGAAVLLGGAINGMLERLKPKNDRTPRNRASLAA